MATMEEVSARLMQPAKDLSDWNYPLAKDLEKYSTAAVKAEDINFSNAGLVVQNSANIYVRRIEYLFQDTIIMAQSLADHEAAEETTKNLKKDSRNRKIVVDFGDFAPIDFAQYVGKNNNIKVRTGINNSVKLLSQRFPQLENVSRSSLPIEVYDVHGGVVGKKYDFRCNQYLTASGMLVEHLTSEDFPDVSSADGNTNISSECTERNVALNAITEHCDSGNEDDTEVHESLSGVENCGVSVVVQENDTDILDTSFASYADSGLGTSLLSPDITTRPESSLSCDPEIPWDSSRSRAVSSLSIGDENNLVGRNSELLHCSKDIATSDHRSSQNTTERCDESYQCDSSGNNGNVDESENTVACADTEDKDDDEIVAQQNRRSKRIKNVIDAVNDLNSKPWEPIPFNSVPDEILKSRAEFKLPCPISLLTFKERPRKRKISPGKKRSLARFLINESESTRKKMTMYSPTRQLFLPFKKEQFEDFQRNFELRFKNRSNVDAVRYEAVTTMSMDLLGYRTNLPKSDRKMVPAIGSSSDEEFRDQADLDAFNYEAVTNISMDLLGFTTNVSKSDSLLHEDTSTNDPSETNEHMECGIDDFPTSERTDHMDDEFPMPDTPESSGSSERLLSPTPIPSYHSRIERSVREIYDSSDVRTAQEEAVARWHEHIKPKLREAELRPPFDMSQYSARVIQNLQAMENHRIEFKEMVQQQMAEPTEIARYFLASLQLANTYNVHIDTGHDVEGNLTLVLLDKDRSSNK